MSEIIMYDEEFRRIDEELKRLYQLANAKLVVLVDKNGQLISSAGDTHDIDTTALASLTAGNIAATGGIAKLLGQKEFSILFHEGEKDNLHLSLVANKVILVVVFDQRTSLGLVRLRVKRSTQALERIFEELERKSKIEEGDKGIVSPFSEITDEDIDRLFG
ncbi:MAG TPA: roadblock/LC7 domain-containing protein [Nitrospirae bacterium]|nr:roadblock/LC7 domain-containing protein [Nitrospirota bacterium]